MKTAIQELMGELRMREQREKGNDLATAYMYSAELAEELLETEKQQIIDSNINGTQEAFIIAFKSLSGRDLIFTDEDLENQKQEAENYYNETYTTNKETLK